MNTFEETFERLRPEQSTSGHTPLPLLMMMMMMVVIVIVRELTSLMKKFKAD
jgi:hypothetical protein